VDDQPDVLDTLSVLLRRDGHDVRAFRDPRAAVDAVCDARPDVLLTDLGMPGLSGWDVARLARERWPDLPVVCVVSGSDPASMESGVPGADLYVEKAYVPEQLERIYAAARAREVAG
jgi:CheY-like chemotaxis protein